MKADVQQKSRFCRPTLTLWFPLIWPNSFVSYLSRRVSSFLSCSDRDENIINTVFAANSPQYSRRSSAVSFGSDSDTDTPFRQTPSHLPAIDIPFLFSEPDTQSPHRPGQTIERVSDEEGFHHNRSITGNTLEVPSGVEYSTRLNNRRHSNPVIAVTPAQDSIRPTRCGSDAAIRTRPREAPVISIEPAPPLGAARKPPTGHFGAGNLFRGPFLGQLRPKQ